MATKWAVIDYDDADEANIQADLAAYTGSAVISADKSTIAKIQFNGFLKRWKLVSLVGEYSL